VPVPLQGRGSNVLVEWIKNRGGSEGTLLLVLFENSNNLPPLSTHVYARKSERVFCVWLRRSSLLSLCLRSTFRCALALLLFIDDSILHCRSLAFDQLGGGERPPPHPPHTHTPSISPPTKRLSFPFNLPTRSHPFPLLPPHPPFLRSCLSSKSQKNATRPEPSYPRRVRASPYRPHRPPWERLGQSWESWRSKI